MNPNTKIVDITARLRTRGGEGSPPRDAGIMLGRGLTHADMSRLERAFADPTNEREHRDRAIFAVVSRTGLRARELVSLRLSSAVTLPDGTLAFPVRRKRGKTIPAIPGETALAAVRAYHAHAGEKSDCFFLSLPNRARGMQRTPLTVRSLERIVSDWGKRFGIIVGRERLNNRTGEPTRDLSPHAFRHTVLQRIYSELGANVAAKLGGHSSPKTVDRFYTATYFDASGHLHWT